MALALGLGSIAGAACLTDGLVAPRVTLEGAVCENGFASGHPCRGVDLVSGLRPHEIGVSDGALLSDLWGWTDPVTGTEWVLVGHEGGTSFVSLADPERPLYAGVLPLTAGALPSYWRDIKVYRDHAYIVADGTKRHGMQVFDLTRLREVDSPPRTFEADAVYDRIYSAHNIAINSETGFAYSVGGEGGGDTCGGGLHMIDVRDPKNPAFAGCFTDPVTGLGGTGYTHDATCVLYRGPDAEHRGKEICFGSNESALSIADVSDKSRPLALAAVSHPTIVYAHQGWLDDAHEYFYMNDEQDELAGEEIRRSDGTLTLVWDVKDLDDPVVVREFIGTTRATDHNLYIVGDLMYQSNYAAGLRVVSIADRENPVEVAFFDLDPEIGDEPGTDTGSWSNYPFMASGIIAATSMESGVFFVRLSGRR